jgi:hypothetical protein
LRLGVRPEHGTRLNLCAINIHTAWSNQHLKAATTRQDLARGRLPLCLLDCLYTFSSFESLSTRLHPAMTSNTTQPIVMLPGSYDDRGPGLRAFVIVLLIVMILSITLRFWSRALAKAGADPTPRFWWDDWLSLLALVTHLPYLGR